MNKDDILRIAKEAGMSSLEYDEIPLGTQITRCSYFDLKRFASLVAEYERQECAKLARKQRYNIQYLTAMPPTSAAARDIQLDIEERKHIRFG